MELLIKEIHEKITALEKDIRAIKEHLDIKQPSNSPDDGGEMGRILAGRLITNTDVFKDVKIREEGR